MDGVHLLRKHGVEFNASACVGRETAQHVLEVYQKARAACLEGKGYAVK